MLARHRKAYYRKTFQITPYIYIHVYMLSTVNSGCETVLWSSVSMSINR